MIVAIDGPSGTGKSTVAKSVAARLGFTFFDTGAMYRSFAYWILKNGVPSTHPEEVSKWISSFQFSITKNQEAERAYLVNGIDVTQEIRSPEISSISSQIATYPEVRKAMVKMQRRFGRASNAVFEGRDMGTVVFPDADVKIFLTANPAIRAERRYKELVAKFPDLSEELRLDQVMQEMADRDQNDSNRSISPLRQAPDALLIDTSDLTIDQVVERILAQVPKNSTPPMKWSYRLIHSLAHFFFRAFFRLKVYGKEHLRPGAGLLIANHTSNYDPPVLSSSCPDEVHFLAKESLFQVPLLGSLIRILNAHPVSRSSSDLHVLKEMIQMLSQGKKLIVFPEGKRSPDGTLHPFERGFSFLSMKAKCPIFPAYIQGTYEAWPIHRKIPRLFGKIVCVFGSPIEWDDFEDLPKKEAEEALQKRCFEAISALKEWIDEGAKGSSP